MEEALAKLWGSIVGRPYVWLFLAGYVLCATWQFGWRRMLAFIPVGYLIAFASEYASITTGFPYGWYYYRYEALENDLLIASPGVPFFDSISYVFLCFAGWSMAYALIGPIRHGASRWRYDIRWAGDSRNRRRPKVLLFGAFLTMWIDVVIDPIAHRGDEWFLGLIYGYGLPGGDGAFGPTYFDIALTNFGGWFLTALVIIAAYAVVDALFDHLRTKRASESKTMPAPRHGDAVPAAGLAGAGLFLGVVSFGLIVSLALAVQRFAAGNTAGGWEMIALFACGAALHAPFVLWLIVRARRVAKAAVADTHS